MAGTEQIISIPIERKSGSFVASAEMSAARPLSFALYRRDALVRRQTVMGPIVKIGRQERSHLRIDDPHVSRMHAVLEVVDDGEVTLIDLGSDEGTFVNDTRINKCTIRPGDRVRMGATTLVWEDGTAGAAAGEADAASPPQLPTPERVRNELGEAFAPEKLFGVAALVLQIDGVRREAWADDVELSKPLFDAFPRGAILPPEVGVERRFKLIDDAAPTREQRCSTCIIRPGFSPCTVCMGTGAGSHGGRHEDPCGGCEGEGFLKCETCNGTTTVVACSVRYINDHPTKLRRTLVPGVDRKLRPYLEASIDPTWGWPAAHVFDPAPNLVGTAYRGASAIRTTTDFHGFFFGDAIAHCLAAREEASAGLARFVDRVFAVPVLWTVTGERHAAYFYDPRGWLRRVAQDDG
jgi:hypothetical protein